jgi:hypothetical protein
MLVLSLSQRTQHNSIKEKQRQKWAFSWARPDPHYGPEEQLQFDILWMGTG